MLVHAIYANSQLRSAWSVGWDASEGVLVEVGSRRNTDHGRHCRCQEGGEDDAESFVRKVLWWEGDFLVCPASHQRTPNPRDVFFGERWWMCSVVSSVYMRLKPIIEILQPAVSQESVQQPQVHQLRSQAHTSARFGGS